MVKFEETLEKNFFGPLAGPERTHEAGTPKVSLPYGPMFTLLFLSSLLTSVFLAAIIWPLVDSSIRPPPPINYYPNADIVGLAITMFLLFLLTWSFLAVSLTDPGRVPKRFPWDPKAPNPNPSLESIAFSDESTVLNPTITRMRGIEKKLDGRTRFCKRCNMYKPDRAHHCKKLGRCVLEMDHWCPWVRNTIGFYNRKYFFLSVTYGWITLLSYCIVLGPYLPPSARLTNALDFFIIFCWVLASIECILLFALWVFHIFLTVNSFTTIEFREKHLAKDSKVKRSGDKIRDLYKQSLYDVGSWAGFKHLLGPNILLWGIPTRYGMSNEPSAGAIFEVRKDHPLLKLAKQGSAPVLATSSSRLLSPGQDDDEKIDDGLTIT